jgi:hypothetical protein
MSPKSLEEYTVIFVKRYKRANYNQKKKILDEYCKVTGYHRKHAIRKLNNFRLFIKKKLKKRGRASKYNKKPIIDPIKKIWLTANLPCSKILKSLLPFWLPHYMKTHGFIDQDTLNLLESISPATIDRIFKPIRPKFNKKGYSGTKPGSLLRKNIPIKTDQWNEFQPGFIESDTVHHCGETVAGQYVLTVNYDDIATGWTEQRAVWGKGETGVLNQTEDVENSLPFKILGFDSDNGGEFINQKLVNYFTCRDKYPVQFTRSRAYHSNDNSHVEQKNWTHVRQWLGYDRFENQSIVDQLNDLYKSEWRFYHNFFIPSVKLLEKKRVASKTIKRYDKPKTPYQRLLEADSNHISDETKAMLTKQYEALNPFELRVGIEKKINKILKLSTKR